MEINKFIRMKYIGKKNALTYLLVATIILGLIIPTILHGRPFGTDAYSHIEETEDMYESSSLYEFYEESSMKILHPTWENNPYNYPFGLWLFGSILAKITGIGPYDMACLLPLIFLFIIISSFYLYFGLFHKKNNEKLFSLLFLLSIPTISIHLMRYRPSVFTIPFVLLIFYFTLTKEHPLKHSLFFISIGTFILSFTHTGTFMFLLFLSITYVFIYAIFCGDLHKKVYLLIVLIFLSYFTSMSLFPEILPQYTDKSRLVLTTGDFLSSKLNLYFINDFSSILYQKIFVEFDLVYIIFWLALIFSLIELIRLLRFLVLDIKKIIMHGHMAIGIPFLGGFGGMSNSILATPFWIGPLQSLFSIVGFFRLKREGMALFISVIFVTLIPASLQMGATGALREIFYLYIIIPTTSTIGLLYVVERIKQHNFLCKLTSPIVFVILLSFIITPLVGNIYYLPTISHADYQVDGMKWLSKFGSPVDRIEGFGYRDVEIFTKKETVLSELMHGKETSYFISNLRKIYFGTDSEEAVRNLYTNYNLKYYLVSEKIAENLRGEFSDLKINSNTELDNIYNSKDFSIFNNPTKSTIYPQLTDRKGNVEFEGDYPPIKDIGTDFLVETDTYKIRLSKLEPRITFLGDRTTDLLGEGYFNDYIRIRWYGGVPYGGKYVAYSSDDFPEVFVSAERSRLTYSTIMKSKSEKENWSTVSIIYTFYEKAIKREFIISNDWVSSVEKSDMSIMFSTLLVLPCRNFTYSDFHGKPIKKAVYPSEDSITLDEKVKDTYLAEGNTGIYIKFGDTSPLPESINFQGMPVGEHASFRLSLNSMVSPSESLHVTQYISIGVQDIAKDNVDTYTKTELYPYNNGKIPLVLVSYLRETNPQTKYEEDIFNRSLNAYDMTSGVNITAFTEGIDAQSQDINLDLVDRLKGKNITIIGSTDLFERSFDSYSDQELKIFEMIRNSKEHYDIDVKGFIPESLRYNLDTIDVLTRNNISFMISGPVRTPVKEYYHEGIRHPQFAMYRGKETDMVLLPVSSPSSYSIHGLADIEGIVSGWKTGMQSVIQNDDVCIFLWRSEDMGNELYSNAFTDSITYAEEMGLTLMEPEEIAGHFRLLKNVSLTINREFDSVRFQVINNNSEKVSGLTIKTSLPQVDGLCEYKVTGGEIVRKSMTAHECNLYISTDIDEGASKLIAVYLSTTKKDLFIDFPTNPVQGIVRFSLTDSEGNPVRGAIVKINTHSHISDENGLVEVNLRKGEYVIVIEKPGFNSGTIKLHVGDRVSLLKRVTLIEWFAIGSVTILLILLFRKLMMSGWVQREVEDIRISEEGIKKRIEELEQELKK